MNYTLIILSIGAALSFVWVMFLIVKGWIIIHNSNKHDCARDIIEEGIVDMYHCFSCPMWVTAITHRILSEAETKKFDGMREVLMKKGPVGRKVRKTIQPPGYTYPIHVYGNIYKLP